MSCPTPESAYRRTLRELEKAAIDYGRKTNSENLRALGKAAVQLNEMAEAVRKQRLRQA